MRVFTFIYKNNLWEQRGSNLVRNFPKNYEYLKIWAQKPSKWKLRPIEAFSEHVFGVGAGWEFEKI